jgi:site-specific DNA-cytosine methylase
MEKRYKVLDLGCRTGSAIASWRAAGDVVVGVDWDEFGQQICGDFTKEETWDIIDNVTPVWEDEVKPYDFIWFSPDCSIFSMANMRWDKNFEPRTFEPVSERAKREVEGIKFVIEKIKERNPRLGWVMENPRALMRKMYFVQDLDRATVSYCQYGDSRMKPTDLFGEIPWLFEPKLCKNGDRCHVAAPRGSTTGTQGMSKTDAGRIPFELSFRIREACIKSFENPMVTLEEFR